jgi:hypothetical protein
MSAACFEAEGSSSGRQLYMHVRRTIPYHNCVKNRVPEDEASDSKHVEGIKI